MKLFVKVILMFIFSFAISLLMFSNLLADDEKIPSSDEFVAVEVMPEMIIEETPIYPENLKGTDGVVYVKVFVNKEGNVLKSKLAKSSGVKEFDSSALDVAMKCKYKPAMQNGKPIGVWVTYKVEFVSSKDQTEEKLLLDVPEKQEVDLMPEMIYEKSPEYPIEAKENEIEGTVWVKALVAKDGSVEKADIQKSSGNELLDKSALKAALECKYKPAIKDGKPLAFWVTYRVDFVLSKDGDKEEVE